MVFWMAAETETRQNASEQVNDRVHLEITKESVEKIKHLYISNKAFFVFICLHC